MHRQINFDDSIFILNTRIRLISDILCLDADPELFLEKTIDDMDFIDGVLSVLLTCLTENRMLVDREEVLNKLLDLEWRLDQLFTGIRGNSGLLHRLVSGEQQEKLARLKGNGALRRKTIENSHGSSEQTESTPIVSSFELNQLLSKF